jgi:hypothetical protein
MPADTPMPRRRPFLVAGPYRQPGLRIGDRTTCLYRDRSVIIAGLSSAPIQWPRCCAVDVGGHPGLLVDEVLLGAIRTETTLALRYWFGVSGWVVWTWRKAFGIGRFGTEGSLRLHQHSSRAGAAALKRHRWTAAESQERGKRALRLRLVRHTKKGLCETLG